MHCSIYYKVKMRLNAFVEVWGTFFATKEIYMKTYFLVNAQCEHFVNSQVRPSFPKLNKMMIGNAPFLENWTIPDRLGFLLLLLLAASKQLISSTMYGVSSSPFGSHLIGYLILISLIIQSNTKDTFFITF